MQILQTFAGLFSNFGNLTWQMVVMWVIGGLLIYLAIVKKMEPSLLLPMNSSSGNSSLDMPASNSAEIGPTVSPWVMAPDSGRLTRIAPKPIGSRRLGSIFLTMAR